MFRAAISENAKVVENIKLAKPSAALAFDPASIPARSRFLNRRTKLLRNLIKWRKYSGERFGIGDTIRRLVDESISDIARGGWDGGQAFIDQVRHLQIFYLTLLTCSRRKHWSHLFVRLSRAGSPEHSLCADVSSYTTIQRLKIHNDNVSRYETFRFVRRCSLFISVYFRGTNPQTSFDHQNRTSEVGPIFDCLDQW